MKIRNILLLLGSLLIAPIYLTSCGEDRWAHYAEQTQTDQWIYDTMKVHYYWQDAITSFNETNFFLEPFTFFKGLLSKEDGKNGYAYSTLDSIRPQNTRSIPYSQNSYGFEFSLYQLNGSHYSAQVLYVLKDSPAERAGLHRGDWILAVNKAMIDKNNLAMLFAGGKVQLTVGDFDKEKNELIARPESVTLGPSGLVNDHPILAAQVYESGNKKVGYLMYNHFTSGTNANDHRYDDDLRATSLYFANEHVNEFILDLRYNNGGLLSCAQLLCTLLAPADAIDKSLGFLQYNKKHSSDNAEITFDSDLLQGGVNLNLSRLYVLTSAATASASEFVINGLKPYMEVILIGDQTEGKNVGSTTFVNEDLQLIMKPVVCKIFNARHESNYKEGFTPNIVLKEGTENIDRFLPIGDPEELLLHAALEQIKGETGPIEPEVPEEPKVEKSKAAVLIQQSINRRAAPTIRLK